MKIYYKVLALLLMGFILTLVSCGKDDTIMESSSPMTPAPAVNTFGTISGLVFDGENQTMEGVTISIANSMSVTDENGYYTVTGFFDSNGTHIKGEKEGYYTAHGIVAPLADETLLVNIVMKEKTTSNGGDAESQIIYNSEHALVTFDQNSFVDNSGNKYQGEVQIAGSYTDPTQVESSKFILGELASRSLNNQTLLQSFGILSLEMFGVSGQELQIDAPAEVSIKVPANLLSIAPSELPMWYRDTDTGFWVKDGMATLVGDVYVGKVTHFTDWMCASEFEFHVISGVVTRDNMPYSRAEMYFKVPQYFSANIFTSNSGTYRKLMIDSDDFDIQIFDFCQTLVHEELGLPVLDSDREFDIDVEGSSIERTLSGVVYCENLANIVDQAYIIVTIDNVASYVLETVEGEGTFYDVLPDCSATEFSVVAYDPNTQTKSEIVILTEIDNEINLNVCDEPITGSITFQIEGEPEYVIPGCAFRIDTVHTPSTGDSLFVEVYNFSTTDYFLNNPEGMGEEVFYEISVYTRYVPVPGHPNAPIDPPPFGPPVDPTASMNAPFYYDFNAVDFTEVVNDQTQVIFNIETSRPGTSLNTLARFKPDGTFEKLNGTVTAIAFK